MPKYLYFSRLIQKTLKNRTETNTDWHFEILSNGLELKMILLV